MNKKVKGGGVVTDHTGNVRMKVDDRWDRGGDRTIPNLTEIEEYLGQEIAAA